MKRYPVAGPSITEREIRYVTDAVINGWYENCNLYIDRFERGFADYVGTRYAVSLPSCTSAIHLSLAALGIGPGDEVIVPDATWIASAAPIGYVGAKPVFADIDAATWCLDAKSFEAAVTPRSKAVIVVDLYGNMPDWTALRDVATRHGIAIIEDAAEAVGATYDGRKAGSFGVTGTFSFHGSKTVTTGEGGMLVTDDKAIYDRVMVLRDHGRVPNDVMFNNREVAFKYKMSGLQAALGFAQIERAEELVAHKRATFDWYRRHLAGIPGVTLNSEAANVRNAYWMVTIVLDDEWGVAKEQLIQALKARGVDTRPFFHPLSSLAAYADLDGVGRARMLNVNSYRIAARGVNLPSALSLTEGDVADICRILREVLAELRKVAPPHRQPTVALASE